MSELYRLRTTEQLLDNHCELQRQTIFFAGPSQLNDPMEGLRNVVWRGDRIAWLNLFKHYVGCLQATYAHTRVELGSPCPVGFPIPVTSHHREPGTSALAFPYQTFWTHVAGDRLFSKATEKLGMRGRATRRDELLLYFLSVHTHLISSLDQFHAKRLGLPPLLPGLSLSSNAAATLEALVDSFDTVPTDDVPSDQLASIAIPVRHTQLLRHWDFLRTQLDEDQAVLARSLVTSFPEQYLDSIVDGLLGPGWYTACFSANPDNSSMWGNYGDSHQGMCLIFRADHETEQGSLQLTGPENTACKLPLHEVEYTSDRDPVDFFRSIGRLPQPQLMEQWYTDSSGNVSECAAHLSASGNTAGWRQELWETYLRNITRKTNDWSHEAESRLVLYDLLAPSLTAEQRTLSYHFSSLSGIIFGIRSSLEDQCRVIDLIRGKCMEHDVGEFRFQQAHYSPAKGRMEFYNLHIPIT